EAPSARVPGGLREPAPSCHFAPTRQVVGGAAPRDWNRARRLELKPARHVGYRPPHHGDNLGVMTEGAAVTSAEALQRLIAGNERFVRGASAQRPPQHDRLVELVEAQHPFATILGCRDSRV